MDRLKFKKAGDIDTVLEKMRTPLGEYLGQTLEAAAEGRENAEQELRRIVADAQKENIEWVTVERFEPLHQDTRFRLVDVVLITGDGRILTEPNGRSYVWSTVISYGNYPKIQLCL